MARRSFMRSFMLGSMAVFAKASKVMAIASTLPMVSVLMTALSLLVSTIAYSLLSGMLVAIMLMLLLLVHETGHIVAMHHKGLPIKLPLFIPFLGAVIAYNLNEQARETESFVAYAGPFIGAGAAYLCLLAWWISDEPILLFGAWLGILINLFNLIPLHPLDGGRILQIVSPKVKYYGLAVFMIFTLWMREPVYLLLWVLILPNMNLPIWWRAGTAIGLTTLMISLMALGYGDQPFAVDVVDTVVAVGLTGACTYADWRRAKLIAKYGDQIAFNLDNRPYPDSAVRVFWLLIYVMSVALLGGTFWWLTQTIANGA